MTENEKPLWIFHDEASEVLHPESSKPEDAEAIAKAARELIAARDALISKQPRKDQP